MSKKLYKLILIVFIGCLIFSFFAFDLGKYLSLDYLQSQKQQLLSFKAQNLGLTAFIFFVIYILTTALSIPGATVLTLAAGFIFGVVHGTIIVSFASTIGATLAFLVSRFLLRDFVYDKFKDRFEKINKGVEKDGAFYLFSLRLIPVFPFFLINLAMGLTRIKTFTYFFVSQVGMLPATIVYVNAGTQLSEISSPKDILSFELALSFALIGIIPLFSKWFVRFLKSRKVMKQYKKPKSFDYNMVVIGAGSAGLVSAYIASAVKAKVALIEKHKMGGDCLNTGCVPSKAIIKSAKVMHQFNNSSKYGIDSLEAKTNFKSVMDRIKDVIKKIEPHDSVERYTSLGVECFQGDAEVLSPYEVKVNGKTLTTKNIVVSTGARPLVPNIPGLDKVNYLTSDNLWDITEQPKKLVILGGGPIGCELAQSFSRLGSEVTIVEMASHIMSKEDKDVSTLIEDNFKKEGIKVLTNHKAEYFEAHKVICDHKGKKVEVEFDRVLVALGRKANVEGFGLEKLNIELSNTGTIVANEYLQTTNIPNIYVCGDVTGPYQFTHVASHQAWFCAVNALFSPLKKFKVDYRVIPWCTFTDPEVARVGLNEDEAKEKNIPYEVYTYGIDDLDRAIADSDDLGFVKVLVKPKTDKILGVTIVGSHAGDIIAEYVTAMKYGIGLNKILGTIHIYPTLAEANKFAAGVWKKANAPESVLNWLQKFHAWRRG